jgi:predicted TIM-barrel fold metal-dependent hydrolase
MTQHDLGRHGTFARRPGLSIIDSQIHLWAAPDDVHRWPAESARNLARTAVQSSAAKPPMSADELVATLDATGVDGAILVPPVFAGDDNSPAIEAARAHPDRFRVMGRVPLEQDSGRRELDRWDTEPLVVGARLTFFWPQHQAALDRGEVEWLWEAAAARDIPIAVICPGRLGVIDDVAARHPALRIVVDHLGMDLELKDAAALAAIPQLLTLAARPNIAVKASTLPSYVTEPYPFPSLYEPIRSVVEAFGPRRVFWGSELTRLPVPYQQAVRHFTDALDFLSQSDLEWIMGRGIREWLGMP